MLNDKFHFCVILTVIIVNSRGIFGYFNPYTAKCGPFGFACEGISKLKLCDGEKLLEPTFLCPSNTVCNTESTDICENTNEFIDPSLTKSIRCHRSERIADTSVPDCKGYILCIPNKNRFQGIKFKCTGNTVFNGYTSTCTSPEKYKCPMVNSKKTKPQYYGESIKRGSNHENNFQGSNIQGHRPIDCKNYKFTVTQDTSPARATYFCPTKPPAGESTIRCTIFSNHFCMTLERDVEDQFIQSAGAAFRKPRVNNP